jgi:hypothetical protein
MQKSRTERNVGAVADEQNATLLLASPYRPRRTEGAAGNPRSLQHIDLRTVAGRHPKQHPSPSIERESVLNRKADAAMRQGADRNYGSDKFVSPMGAPGLEDMNPGLLTQMLPQDLAIPYLHRTSVDTNVHLGT